MFMIHFVMNFNPLRREGGDIYIFSYRPPISISIHSAARAETLIKDGTCIVPDISIHSAARAETGTLYPHSTRFSNFNPLRREGGDQSPSAYHLLPDYFNPLRREGGDNKNVIVLKDATISIHSAARAETQAPWGNQAHGEFQSTPPRGRRRIGGTSHTKRVDFNPLRREGGDVSPPTLCNNDAEFQSTPPRGRRPSSPRQLENFWTFQSTPPRGRRPLAACFSAGPICDFNPLRREGGDVHGPQQRMITQYISIHSAARAETIIDAPMETTVDENFNPLRREGGDLESQTRLRHIEISIHSAARAETNAKTQILHECLISIHSAARAETSRCWQLTWRSLFQSTPPRGRRRRVRKRPRKVQQFQSTPPRGRRRGHGPGD